MIGCFVSGGTVPHDNQYSLTGNFARARGVLDAVASIFMIVAAIGLMTMSRDGGSTRLRAIASSGASC